VSAIPKHPVVCPWCKRIVGTKPNGVLVGHKTDDPDMVMPGSSETWCRGSGEGHGEPWQPKPRRKVTIGPNGPTRHASFRYALHPLEMEKIGKAHDR
jgi:hypothetical protein